MEKTYNYQLQQVKIFTKTVYLGIFSLHILLPIVFSILFYQYVDKINMIAYISLNIIILSIRLIINKKLIDMCKIQLKNINNYLFLIAFCIILAAFLHLYAFASIFSSLTDTQMLIVVSVIVAYISGSMTTLVTMYSLLVTFVISNIVPISGLFFYHGGYANITIAIVLLIYGAISLINGHKYFDILKESILLKDSFQNKVEEATQELKNKNDLLSIMIDTSMVMVIFYDKNNILVGANQKAYERFGYKEEVDVLGKNIFTFVPEESISKVEKSLRKDNSTPHEIVLQTKDAAKFHALISGTNTILDGEDVRLTIMLDLSDIKEKDKMMYHQAKLAQMGEMMSMIAHQWRQPLSAISATSISLNLQSKLGTTTKDGIEKATQNITKYTKYLSETIDDFRDFFKPNKEMELTNYDKILEIVNLIIKQPLIQKNIELSVDLKSNENFYTYSNEVKQVLLNVVKNAEDAIVENETKDPHIKISTYFEEKSDLKHILEIRDNAGGIPNEIIDKIFEPYFSTKLEKNGTGLGLYMSKMIIENHCYGKLEISNVDSGTLVKISLGNR